MWTLIFVQVVLSAFLPNKPLNEAGDLFLSPYLHIHANAGPRVHADPSCLFVAVLSVEQASGSNLPVDKSTACICVLDEPFEVGRSVRLSFSPTRTSCGECDWAQRPPDQKVALMWSRPSLRSLQPTFILIYKFVYKAQEAEGYGPSMSALNLTNVMSENGSPSWNATGKGGVICPLPLT